MRILAFLLIAVLLLTACGLAQEPTTLPAETLGTGAAEPGTTEPTLTAPPRATDVPPTFAPTAGPVQAENTPEPASPSATPQASPTEASAAVDTPAGPGVHVFVDGADGDVFTGKDMQMAGHWPTKNGGAHPEFQFEKGQRSLLEFDLSAIPASAKCQKATLYLYHNYDPEMNDPVANVTIYSLSAANAGWNAGVQDIDPAAAGESTWNALASDGAGGATIPWAGSPGATTPGVDYEEKPVGSLVFDPHTPKGTEIAIELDPARVQGWFGENNTNYGIIMISERNSGHVAQSDNRNPAFRPKLVVEYVTK